MDLKQYLTSNNSELSPKSILSYISNLKSVHKSYNKLMSSKSDINVKDLDFLLNEKPVKVIKALQEVYTNTNTQRNLLNSIIIFTKASKIKDDYISQYENERDLLHEKYESQAKSHMKTEKQKANWITLQEFDDVLAKMKKRIKDFNMWKLYNEEEKAWSYLQSYVILSMYRKFPLRNDINNLKYIYASSKEPIDKETNYMVISSKRNPSYSVTINQYKTAKSNGPIKFDIIDKELIAILKKWIKISSNEQHYLFTQNDRKTALTPSQLSKTIINVFKKELNKSVGSSMLRHIQLSAKYADVIEDMKKDSKLMGHSLGMQRDYVKFTDESDGGSDDK
jgi:hypothetical protein